MARKEETRLWVKGRGLWICWVHGTAIRGSFVHEDFDGMEEFEQKMDERAGMDDVNERTRDQEPGKICKGNVRNSHKGFNFLQEAKGISIGEREMVGPLSLWE